MVLQTFVERFGVSVEASNCRRSSIPHPRASTSPRQIRREIVGRFPQDFQGNSQDRRSKSLRASKSQRRAQ